MSRYVPTTDEVRRDFMMLNEGQHPTATREELHEGFDAWLDGVRAAARREGQAEAWEKCAHVIGDGLGASDAIAHNPYRQEAGQ